MSLRQKNQNLELFIQKIHKYTYTDVTELTPYAANELVKAIYIGTPYKCSVKRRKKSEAARKNKNKRSY